MKIPMKINEYFSEKLGVLKIKEQEVKISKVNIKMGIFYVDFDIDRTKLETNPELLTRLRNEGLPTFKRIKLLDIPYRLIRITKMETTLGGMDDPGYVSDLELSLLPYEYYKDYKDYKIYDLEKLKCNSELCTRLRDNGLRFFYTLRIRSMNHTPVVVCIRRNKESKPKLLCDLEPYEYKENPSKILLLK